MPVRSSFTAGEVLTAADVTDTFASKVDYATPANAQSGTGASAYTFVLADASRLTTATGSSAKTFTIPPQANVAWVANTILRVANTGTGALTIAGGSGVTVTNAGRTLDQFESAKVIRTGSNAWTVLPDGGAAGGKILQIVRDTDTTQRLTTSTSFVDITGMSVTITPQKSDSAVILLASLEGAVRNLTQTSRARFQITDASNNAISGAENYRLFIQAGGVANSQINVPMVLFGYATPATTSAVTYKVRFRTEDAGYTAEANNHETTGQLYAIEVSA